MNLSRACEDRLKSGSELTGYFLKERLQTLSECIADIGVIAEKMSLPSDGNKLARQLLPLSEALGKLELQALRIGDE